MRIAFRVSVRKEAEDLETSRAAEAPPLARANLEVANPNLEGLPLGKVPTLARRFGVQITRVSRAEVEMSATPDFELQYGDTVIAVGEAGDIQKVAAELGDSPKSLNYPHLVPMFAGIALGIVVGRWPSAQLLVMYLVR